MKYWVALQILLLSAAHATKLAFGAGGVTPHYSNSRIDYCKRMDDRGTVYNNTYYLRVSGTQHAFTALAGEDSICSPIYGAFYSYLIRGTDVFWELNFTFGAYTNNKEDWVHHKQTTPKGYHSVEAAYINIDGFRFIPVFGLELNFAIARGKSWALKQNNLFAYYISNHSISFELTF